MGDHVIGLLTRGLMSWIMTALGEIINWFDDVVGAIFGGDQDFFTKLFDLGANGAGSSNYDKLSGMLQAIGFALCVLLVILALLRNVFSGLGVAGESPVKMIFKFILSFFLVWIMAPLMQRFYSTVFSALYNGIMGLDFAQSLGGSNTGALWDAASLSFAGTGIIVVYLILFIAIIMNYARLLIELIERYLLVNLVVLFSPLAAPTFATEDTTKIFVSFCKFYFGQLVMLLFNAISLQLLTLGFYGVSNMFGESTIQGIIALLALLAFLKLCQRFDNYLRDIGVTVGVTGDNLLAEFAGAAGTVKSLMGGSFTKGFGKAGGSAAKAAGAAGAAGMAAGIAGSAGKRFSTLSTGGIGIGAKALGAIKGARMDSQSAENANKTFGELYKENFKASTGFDGSRKGVAAAHAFKSATGNAPAQVPGTTGGLSQVKRMTNGNFLGVDAAGNMYSFSKTKPNGNHVSEAGNGWYADNITAEAATYMSQNEGAKEYAPLVAAQQAWETGYDYSAENISTKGTVAVGDVVSAPITGIQGTAESGYSATVDIAGASQNVPITQGEAQVLTAGGVMPVKVSDITYSSETGKASTVSATRVNAPPPEQFYQAGSTISGSVVGYDGNKKLIIEKDGVRASVNVGKKAKVYYKVGEEVSAVVQRGATTQDKMLRAKIVTTK